MPCCIIVSNIVFSIYKRPNISSYMLTTFDEDFTLADLDFFWGKCHDYLERIYTKTYNADTAEEWKAEYIKGQAQFKNLEKELLTVKTEDEINAWEARLQPTYKEMENALRQLQWGPDFDKWQSENTKQNQFLAYIKDDIYVCKRIVQEILRIVNPHNPKYKNWFGHSRRDFLVEIGHPKVQPGPPPRFWKPPAAALGRKTGVDIHTLLRQLQNI